MDIRKTKIITFIFSFLYVGLATFSILTVYPKDIFHNCLHDNISVFIGIVTFPAYIVSFGYRFAEGDVLYPVFIIQFLIFNIVWYLSYIFLKNLVK